MKDHFDTTLERKLESNGDEAGSQAAGVRRIDVINGVERRRRWPDRLRLAMMAEALEPGAIISCVARRHDVSPSQLIGWLKKLRTVRSPPCWEIPTRSEVPLIIPAVLETTSGSSSVQEPAPDPGLMEITRCRAEVIIRGKVDEGAPMSRLHLS